jgi:putative transposase
MVETKEVTVSAVCKALEMERSTYYRQVERMKEKGLLTRACPRQKTLSQAIKRLTTQYPTFGYRRIWALLKREGYSCNQKTVYRAMKSMNLLQKTVPFEAKRSVGDRPASPTAPNQRWHVDMTKIWSQEGWAYLVAIIDAYDRRIVSFNVQSFCRDDETIGALHLAVNQTYPEGIREADARLKLVHDNGPQFTSRDFTKTLDILGIESVRTAYKHPQSNGLIERWFRSLKEEEVWLHEYTSIGEVREAVSRYVQWYNEERPHSSLRYKSPMEYHRTSFVLAA